MIRFALADRRLHEFLWFCVPGVVTGLVLRIWLMLAWPYGYYHPDTHDFLTAIFGWKLHYHLAFHGKTTFLTPLLYTIPFLLHLRALLFIPLAQHLRGLLLILLIGALGRLWLERWRIWIIPLTLLAAIQPAMLFWEHALMSESGFVFCAVLLALAGTTFALKPGWPTFGLVLASMFLVAAARPEGNLLLGAGVLLPCSVEWGRWREVALRSGSAVLLALLMLSLTKTTHSGLLLYASLVHLTPDEPKALPGFGSYVRPLRDAARARRARRVDFDVVRTGKHLDALLETFAREHPAALGASSPDAAARALRTGTRLSDLCRHLATESALSHPWALPGLAIAKFLKPIDQDSGGTFQDYTFHQKQAATLGAKADMAAVLGPGLVGAPLDQPGQAEAFVAAHYDLGRVAWFNTLERGWQRGVNALHLPGWRYSASETLPGLPVYFLLAILGACGALFRPAVVRRFQWAFLPVLAGMWFIVAVTSAVIPRHRFVLEPFWLLYFFCFCDALLAVGVGMYRRKERHRPIAAQPAAAVRGA